MLRKLLVISGEYIFNIPVQPNIPPWNTEWEWKDKKMNIAFMLSEDAEKIILEKKMVKFRTQLQVFYQQSLSIDADVEENIEYEDFRYDSLSGAHRYDIGWLLLAIIAWMWCV